MTRYGYYRKTFGHSDIIEQVEYLREKLVDENHMITESPKTRKSSRRHWLQLIHSDRIQKNDEIFVPYFECLGEKLIIIARDIHYLIIERHAYVIINGIRFSAYDKKSIEFQNYQNLKIYAAFQQNLALAKAYDQRIKHNHKGGRPKKITSDEQLEIFAATVKTNGIDFAKKQYNISTATAYNYWNKWKNKKD